MMDRALSSPYWSLIVSSNYIARTYGLAPKYMLTQQRAISCAIFLSERGCGLIPSGVIPGSASICGVFIVVFPLLEFFGFYGRAVFVGDEIMLDLDIELVFPSVAEIRAVGRSSDTNESYRFLFAVQFKITGLEARR